MTNNLINSEFNEEMLLCVNFMSKISNILFILKFTGNVT